MFSNNDIERLIAEKRHEIEAEKILLGLSPAAVQCSLEESENKEDSTANRIQDGHPQSPKPRKSVRIKVPSDEAGEHCVAPEIPADLERYIRRYLGLPVMLKAGEYSPNNPLVRGERTGPGDALVGLGEYERRRNTLRKIRQQQYREYLDEQARKKQEAKERADRERREREERERLREEEIERLREEERERLRQKELERVRIEDKGRLEATERFRGDERERLREKDRQKERRIEDEQRRASVCYISDVPTSKNNGYYNKVDTGVQAGAGPPHSVGVQTDDSELYPLSPKKSQLTQAERELSPRTVQDPVERSINNTWYEWDRRRDTSRSERDSARRRSYGDFDERPAVAQRSTRDKLMSDLRHTYMPSLFDAEAIHMRNVQAEKEAAARRQSYQQELRNQILEQQRIREERRTREKMLEQAEMRRLEEQLRMLRAAQWEEAGRHSRLAAHMEESKMDFDKKRTHLQKEIDAERHKLVRARSRVPQTSRSDTNLKLPSFYSNADRLPYSTNIPENSIFNPNYDVDSYLRKNLNPKNATFKTNFDIPTIPTTDGENKKVIIEKALIHERPKEKSRIAEHNQEKSKYEPSIPNNMDVIDETPIPVLKHTPIISEVREEEVLSPEMKRVEDKWQVPAVQKNILKTMPNEEGKNVSILTQLGSIRRQLQLEQLRLDNMTKRE